MAHKIDFLVGNHYAGRKSIRRVVHHPIAIDQGARLPAFDVTDRLVILAASAWLVYRVRARFLAVPARPSWLALPLLGLACLAFPLGWYLIALVGAKKILLWWVMLSLLAATARSPRLVPQMWRLARQTCCAAGQLALGLGELLTLTLPWTAES